jgi:hypothetical protein
VSLRSPWLPACPAFAPLGPLGTAQPVSLPALTLESSLTAPPPPACACARRT